MPSYTSDKLLCSIADIEDVLSEHGLRLQLDDDHDGAATSTAEANLRERASARVRMYVSKRYDDETLIDSVWLKWAAATCGAYIACIRRGNAPPAGLSIEWEELKTHLSMIMSGQASLPDGAPERRAAIPVISNAAIDTRYPESNVRVVPNQSPRHGPQDIPDKTLTPSIELSH